MNEKKTTSKENIIHVRFNGSRDHFACPVPNGGAALHRDGGSAEAPSEPKYAPPVTTRRQTRLPANRPKDLHPETSPGRILRESKRAGLFEDAGFSFGPCKLVRRRDSGSYYVIWYDAGSRRVWRRSTGLDQLEAAKKRLVEFVEQATLPTPRARPAHAVILDEVVAAYFATHYTNKRPNFKATRKFMDRMMEHFDHYRVRNVDDLTIEAQNRYAAWRRDAGATPQTVHRELCVLKAALNAQRREGRLQYVPYIISGPKSRPRMRWLRHEEVGRLLRYSTDQHLHDFIMICLHTLARPGAVLNLQVQQVDLINRLIDFHPEGEEMTNKRKATIRISDTLMPIMTRLVKVSRSGHVIEYRGCKVSSINTAFRKAATAAGLAADVIPYSLRHTGATHLAKAGVPLYVIAGMMGHSDTQTTEIYAKHSPDFQQGAIAALDKAFSM